MRSRLDSYFNHKWVSPRRRRDILSEIVQFARSQNVDAVWCMLQGQTVIQLALPVASMLNADLYTQVFDCPEWNLSSMKTDPATSRRVMSEYQNAIRNSRRCAAISWQMAKDYQEAFGTETIPILPSLPDSFAVNSPPQDAFKDTVTIGFAGQIYAQSEWFALMHSLDLVNWQIGGREVKVRLIGRYFELCTTKPRRIEYLGFQPQENAIKLLAEADVLYCPYWFDQGHAYLAKHCFPSKLPTYLAAGRPVFFHGPDYSSTVDLLTKTNAGVMCHSNEPNEIVRSFQDLFADEQLYHQRALNAQAAFKQYFQLSAQRPLMSRFLEIEDDSLLRTSPDLQLVAA